MAVVIKEFPYASDGFTVERLKVGAEREFGAVTQGLVDEGYVEAVSAEPVEPADGETPVETKKSKKK